MSKNLFGYLKIHVFICVQLNIILQISMDHPNMSEHVLCMVLYLIELGLDNPEQEETEDKVQFYVGSPWVIRLSLRKSKEMHCRPVCV